MPREQLSPPMLNAWAQEADRLLMRDWCIDMTDAGLSDDEIRSQWETGWTPREFVDWFADKYDLIRLLPPRA